MKSQSPENVFALNRKYLAEDYRAFCSGPLSVCLDRFGGIESIRLLEVLDKDDYFFPERTATDVFTRNGKYHIQPFYNPSLVFGSRMPDEGWCYCDTTAPEVYPESYISRGFEMTLHQNSLSVKIKNQPGGRAGLMIDPAHYFAKTGEQQSLFNQLTGWHEGWLTAEQRGKDYDPDWPIKNVKVKTAPQTPVFDSENNQVVFKIEREYSFGSLPLYAVLRFSLPAEADFRPNRWMIFACKPTRTALFAFGFGHDKETAARHAQQALKQHARRLKNAGRKELFPDCIKLRIKTIEQAEKFSLFYPHYQNAAVVAEDEKYMAIRAAQDKYGFFILWDHLYPSRDFLLMGQPERTEKALRYACCYPHMDTSMMVPIQLLPAINEMLAFLPESRIPVEHLPFFRRFFDFTLSWCDPQTGLLKNPLCLAVDFPEQVGLKDEFFESGMNGMWYNACRCLENFFLLADDEYYAKKAAENAKKIENNYESVFMDNTVGYLRTAVNGDGSLMQLDPYLYTNTWGFDYIHGFYLFRKIAAALADFKRRKLTHPAGSIDSAPEFTPAGSSGTATRMNQHLGHECQGCRCGGLASSAKRLMQCYLEIFDHWHNAVETFNYNYCAGDQTQRADWQTFSATAAMQGLVRGVSGLNWHRGGLFFVPADLKDPVEIQNFHFRKNTLNFKCSGSGAYVKKFSFGGKEITGSMQIPADCMAGEGKTVNWNIIRSSKPWEHPVLLTALDAGISQLESGKKRLAFCIINHVHASLKFYVPGTCSVSVNGKAVDFETIGANEIWLDQLFMPGDRINLELL